MVSDTIRFLFVKPMSLHHRPQMCCSSLEKKGACLVISLNHLYAHGPQMYLGIFLFLFFFGYKATNVLKFRALAITIPEGLDPVSHSQ